MENKRESNYEFMAVVSNDAAGQMIKTVFKGRNRDCTTIIINDNIMIFNEEIVKAAEKGWIPCGSSYIEEVFWIVLTRDTTRLYKNRAIRNNPIESAINSELQIAGLKNELEKAIINEDFEKAAEIRDIIDKKKEE